MTGNPGSMAFRRYAGAEIGEEADDDEDMENKLASKTSKLKQITIQLGDEIRSSNKFLKGLDEDFDKTRGFLGATMSRLGKLSKYGNCKLYFSLILFALFVFFVLYLVIKWKS